VNEKIIIEKKTIGRGIELSSKKKYRIKELKN